jgi:hypothetical protein
MGSTRLAAALAAAVFMLGAGVASAQSGTASIDGRVTDQQGAVVPGATATLHNVATAASRTAVTNQSGLYQFIALPPGVYDLTVSMPGFQTAKFTKLELRVDMQARRDVQLSVGMTEAVTVEGESPLINTTDASVGNTITEQSIQALPVEARNVVHLLSLQPGAVFIPTTNPTTSDPRYGAVSGARADQQNVTLDGIDVNDPQLQSAYTSAVRMTQDALQEFRVSTSNYGAAMGRSSGPQVSLVTKSGSNDFKGSAYWYGRRTATSSNEYFLKLAQQQSTPPLNEPPKLNKNILGGSLGGPIRKNRVFFFFNVEGLKSEGEQPVVRSVPSNSFRDGILQYRCAQPSQCPATTVRGFQNTHSIEAGWYGLTPAQVAGIDPLGIGSSQAASTYFRQFPSPNEPGQDGHNIMNYRFKGPLTNDFKTLVARVDAKLDDAGKHSVFLRVNGQDDEINNVPQYEGQDPRSAQQFKNLGFAAGWDATLSSTLVNSLRYGMTKIDDQVQGKVKANYVTFRFIDNFDPITFTTTRETPTHNLVEELTWLKNAHTWKFGTNLRRTRIPSTRNSGSFLSATINPSWVAGIGRRYAPGNAAFCTSPGCSAVPAVAGVGTTAAGTPSFAAGYADAWLNVIGVVSQATMRANYLKDGTAQPAGEAVARDYATNEYEFYVQDSWRLKSNLTITAGVRYSLASPPYEVNGLQVAPNVSMGEWFDQRAESMKKGIPSNQSPRIQFDLAGPANGGKKGFYDWDKNNIAPRLAIAWTPGGDNVLTGNGKLVVRAGYAKVFDRIGQGLASNFDQGFAFGMSTSISSPFGAAYETNPGARFVNISTMPPTMPATPSGGFPQTPPVRAGIITTSIDDTIKTPYAHMLSFVLGRELNKNLSIEAGYVGRFGRDLLVRRDLAMPLNLTDTKSGMDYFTAAQQMITTAQSRGITGGSPASSYQGLPSIPYWENLFPAAAGGGLTATQAMTRAFMQNAPDYITALYDADESCSPACSIFGPFAYFADQYDSLAALSSVGRSNYNALQATLRKRFSHGYQFDINYTLAFSKDNGSSVERGSAFGNFGNGGYSGFLLNSFDPDAHYGNSDFDIRHQVNFNGLWELPLGKNSHGLLKQVIGDWQVAGLVRWTSGFPFNVQNCRSCWATNWNLQGNAELVNPGQLPALGTTKDAVDHRPSPFKDAKAAANFFRLALPGEVGLRNVLRGDGYFSVDASLSKAWHIVKDHRLRVRFDVFNLTNTAKFDVGQVSMTPDRTPFGNYTGTLATCDAQAGRCAQFALRYEF